MPVSIEILSVLVIFGANPPQLFHLYFSCSCLYHLHAWICLCNETNFLLCMGMRPKLPVLAYYYGNGEKKKHKRGKNIFEMRVSTGCVHRLKSDKAFSGVWTSEECRSIRKWLVFLKTQSTLIARVDAWQSGAACSTERQEEGKYLCQQTLLLSVCLSQIHLQRNPGGFPCARRGRW